MRPRRHRVLDGGIADAQFNDREWQPLDSAATPDVVCFPHMKARSFNHHLAFWKQLTNAQKPRRATSNSRVAAAKSALKAALAGR